MGKAIALAYSERGKGYPILGLHGHPGSDRCLSVFSESLSQHYRVLTPDLRGYGRSRARGPFAMHDHLDDLEHLLDRLAIERCLLLGWSLGGILALELIWRNPQRYSGSILVASAARPRSTHPPVTWQDLAGTGIAGIVNWLRPGWQWNIDTFGRRSLFRYLLGQQTPLPYRYLAAAGVPAYLQTTRPAQRALSSALRQGYDRTADLARIHLPCLVLAGERDRHISPESSRETARHLPDSCWICYPDTAHLFPWEIPDRVLSDIESWLQARPDITASPARD